MFSIIKYEHEFLDKESERLRIHFRYEDNIDRSVLVKIVENSFGVRHQYVGGMINVSNGKEYWVQDIQSRPLMYHYGITVSFIDSKNRDILSTHNLQTRKVNIDKRSFGQDFSIKNTWIIGDSHVNHNFIFGLDYNVENYKTNKKIINPVAQPLLSINRFVNSDYIDYLKNIPIYDGDDICFYLGEIDTRVGIFRNSRLKGISSIDHTITLIERFVKTLDLIQKHFSKCKFYYILPNPPIQDGWIYGPNKQLFLEDSTEQERYLVRYLFEEIIMDRMNKLNVEIINFSSNYVKSNGFVDENFLIENNHHFKYPNNFLSLTKEYFK
jgi:hypothetical protein